MAQDFIGSLQFWGRAGGNSSQFDSLLQSPNVELRQVLLEKDFLDEISLKNTKLIDYLCNNMRQILVYLVEEGDHQENRERFCQLPFLVNEMFEKNNQSFFNTFFTQTQLTPVQILNENTKGEDQNIEVDNTQNQEEPNQTTQFEILDYLFSILQKDKVNSVLSSFFQNLLSKLIEANASIMVQYTYKEQLLDLFLRHRNNQNLFQAFQDLIAIESTKFDNKNQEYKDLKLKTIQKLVNILINSEFVDEILMIITSLTHIIQRYTLIWFGREMVEVIMKVDNLQHYLQKLQNPNHRVVNQFMDFIAQLMRFYCPVDYDNQQEDQYTSFLKSKQLITQKNYHHNKFFQHLIQNFQIFQNLFQQNEQIQIYHLKLIEFLSITIKINYEGLNAEVFSHNLLHFISDLYFKFPKNNIYQSAVYNLIYLILIKENQQYISHMFDKLMLLDILFNEAQKFQMSNKKNLSGHEGSVIQLCNLINHFDQIGLNENWQNFRQQKLKCINDLNQLNLGQFPASLTNPQPREISKVNLQLKSKEIKAMKGDDDGPEAEEDDPVLDRRLYDSITNFMENRLAVDQMLLHNPDLMELGGRGLELVQEQIEIEQEQEKEVNRGRSRSFEEFNNVQVKVLINVENDSNEELYKSELFDKQIDSPKILMDPVQDNQLEDNYSTEQQQEVKILQNFESDDLNNSAFNQSLIQKQQIVEFSQLDGSYDLGKTSISQLSVSSSQMFFMVNKVKVKVVKSETKEYLNMNNRRKRRKVSGKDFLFINSLNEEVERQSQLSGSSLNMDLDFSEDNI